MNNIKNIFLAIIVMLAASISCSALGVSSAYAEGSIKNVAALGLPAETKEYSCPDTMNEKECLKNNPIVKWVQFFTNLFAAIVGVGAVIMVIIAGMQYSAARDNAQSIQSAKAKLMNVLIGLVTFVFLYSFLQWLIPGGAF